MSAKNEKPEAVEATAKEKKIVTNVTELSQFSLLDIKVMSRAVATLKDMPELTLGQAIKFAQKFEQLSLNV